MIGDFLTALKNDDRGDIARSVSELTSAQENMAISLGSIGAKLNNLERQGDINADYRFRLDQLLSGEEDLDYAKAVTQFNAEMVRLEATQASFAKVAQLSLFQFI
jgi:flagellar hook-associated protein 3 FlgL